MVSGSFADNDFNSEVTVALVGKNVAKNYTNLKIRLFKSKLRLFTSLRSYGKQALQV